MSKNISKIKWVIAFAMILSAIVGFQFYQQIGVVIRILALLATAGIALFVASTTTQGRAAVEFILAAKAEAKRVVWPTRQETMQMTGIVVVMVFIVTLFVWLVDSLLIVAMTWFTG